MNVGVGELVCGFKNTLIVKNPKDNLRLLVVCSCSYLSGIPYLLEKGQTDNDLERSELEHWVVVSKILLEKHVHLENRSDGDDK